MKGHQLLMSDNSEKIIKISAKNLIESLYRTGSINQINYSNLSGREGTRTHQAFYNLLRDEYRYYEVFNEINLKYEGYFSNNNEILDELPSEEFKASEGILDGISISGRLDLLLKPIEDENIVSFSDFKNSNEVPDVPFIIEVKTVNRPLEDLAHQGEKLHFLQSKIYTFMYWNGQKSLGLEIPKKIPYAIAYVSVETLECEIKFAYTDWRELSTWFRKTCFDYLEQAINIQKRINLRNASISSLNFPYENIREGQKEFMQRAYKSISHITPLLAQAPTGTGKTISVLFPALKQLLDSEFEHIFYLTAKTSTREVCVNTLRDLREKSGLFARSITLMAKEEICPYHKESPDCPFSLNYYENLPFALEELWPLQEITPEIIQQMSIKHKVCAFELSLDVSLTCDVIIGDYNHVFNPRVQLERFFGKGTLSQIVLVDEAHNLVDRSRDMYSSTLDWQSFEDIKKIIPSETLKLYPQTEYIISYFKKLDKAFLNDEDGFDVCEQTMFNSKSADLCSSDQNHDSSTDYKFADNADTNMRIVKAESFRGTTSALKNLCDLLVPWVQYARQSMELILDPKQQLSLVKLIGESKFFIKIIDEFWSNAYISCARKHQKNIFIRLICLDVAEKLSETYINKHAIIFFSATLSPMEYFSTSFCGNERNNKPDTLSLSSPFPPENLEVYTAGYISTRYKDRKNTAAALAKTIALSILLKGGHQFIYFPSFAYMDLIMPLLKRILASRDIIWMEQKRRMNTEERADFLKEFSTNKGKTVIGLVVLGGIFGEGIDLVGDSLTAVTIVTVGIPQISPERSIMSEYYNHVYYQGFNFAYLYPAINKVLQAAGRLIRSETDKGYILLIDERYTEKQYLDLLPEEWEIKKITDIKELKTSLEASNTEDMSK